MFLFCVCCGSLRLTGATRPLEVSPIEYIKISRLARKKTPGQRPGEPGGTLCFFRKERLYRNNDSQS